MRRRNREINIFNMSALDLFASALGAFILLFAILMPYYLKTSKVVMKENAKLKAEVRECQTQVSDLRQQVQELEKKLAACESDNQKLQAENEQLKQQLDKATKSMQNRVKFALLGINTKAESFVIVIDMSGSMQAYTKTMKNTVARILEPFEGKHKVQIFGYNERGFVNWQSPYGLVGMSDPNKQAGNAFAGKLAGMFGGGTPTKAALFEALKYDAKAIILLTDGAPTDAQPADIVASITQQNAGKKEIHSVAIGDYNAKPQLVAFLQSLSAQNKGAFVGAAKTP